MKNNPILIRKELLELLELCKSVTPETRDGLVHRLNHCSKLLEGIEKDSPIADHLAQLCVEIFKYLIPTFSDEERKTLIRETISRNPEEAIQTMLENMTEEEREELEKRALAELKKRKPRLV